MPTLAALKADLRSLATKERALGAAKYFKTGPGEDGEGKPSSYMAEIQKFAGKLGQELRDQHEKLESDDIKYVLNMIISAVDLDKLSDDDLGDIAKKFEREEDV